MINPEDPALLEIKAYLLAICGKLFDWRYKKMEQTKLFYEIGDLNEWLADEPRNRILRITYHPEAEYKFFVVYVPEGFTNDSGSSK